LVDCPAPLRDVHRKGQQWDPNDGTLSARFTTKFHPQFWILFTNFEFDKVRYGTLHWGRHYTVQKGPVGSFYGSIDDTNSTNELIHHFQSIGYVVHKMGGSSGPTNGLDVLKYNDQHANFTDRLL
jgi:hypothetical protein